MRLFVLGIVALGIALAAQTERKVVPGALWFAAPPVESDQTPHGAAGVSPAV